MSEIKDNTFRNKVITTINKKEEWITNKSIEDYIKEGYIISEEDIAKYNEGKDVEISKPNAIYASSERDVSNSYTKKSYEASIEFDDEVENRAEQRAEEWSNEEYGLYLNFLKTTRDKELASKMTDEEMSKRHPEGRAKFISPTNPYKYQDTVIGTELALFSAIKNPLIVDAHNSNWNDILFNGETYTTRTLEEYARNNGYDGVIVKNVLDIGPYGRLEAHKFSTIVAAINSNQIKSATDNIGTFDSNNPDIRYRKVPSIAELRAKEKSAYERFNNDIEEYYREARDIIKEINYRRFNTEREAMKAFNESGIIKDFFYRITREGANNAAGYKIQLLTRDMIEQYKQDNNPYSDEYKDYATPIENFYFDSLDPEIQMMLFDKGWTKEQFDSISQQERDQAIKCIAL